MENWPDLDGYLVGGWGNLRDTWLGAGGFWGLLGTMLAEIKGFKCSCYSKKYFFLWDLLVPDSIPPILRQASGSTNQPSKKLIADLKNY